MFMNINLQELNYKNEIVIDEMLSYDPSFLENTDIVSLNDVLVKGTIKQDIEFNYVVNLEVIGKMMLHDSVTYDIIPYDFTFTIEEILEKSLKSLDLMEFLWHYIVLEIPLRYTVSEDIQIKNDDYCVISEEEYNNKNNPFKDFFLE